ncbi:MAG: Na+/H+ antiporter subunit E [Neptuniibacter sp.]
MLHYVVLIPVLCLFWLMLSGQYNLMFFTFGALAVALTVWFQVRMDRVDQEPAKVRMGFAMINYAIWLLWEIIRTNIDLAKRIWHPEMPVDPVWKRLDTSLKTSREKTLYANSITLTPGTLTTDVHDDYLMVHTLTPEMMEELEEGEMEDQIRKLGI